jgi:hypothetical protein
VLRPSEPGLDQQHESEEETREEAPDVREVVDVGEYPYGEVDGGDDEQVRHGRDPVGVDGPVGDELRQHRSEEAEERAGGTDGDAVVLDEEHREDAAADARQEVDQANLPCRRRRNQVLKTNDNKTACAHAVRDLVVLDGVVESIGEVDVVGGNYRIQTAARGGRRRR